MLNVVCILLSVNINIKLLIIRVSLKCSVHIMQCVDWLINFPVYSPILHHDVAYREQYPLRLAFGITIHRAQGMTLTRLYNVILIYNNVIVQF
jgi:hypothetical protein